MASLQQTLVSLQSKLPPSSCMSIAKSLPLRVSIPNRRSRGAAGARMSVTPAGSYAQALADVARANNTLESTFQDVEKLEKLFSDDEVLGFFTNPIIPIEKKLSVVDDISKSSSLLPYTSNFIKLLVDSKRIDAMRDIVKEFDLVYNRLTGTEIAVVSSVVKLEQQHLAQIAKQVQKMTGAKNVRIKTFIDPSLVAGFTIRFGDSGSKFIDMSVKKQLEEITAQIDLGDLQLAAV